jgi:hypothetical protein
VTCKVRPSWDTVCAAIATVRSRGLTSSATVTGNSVESVADAAGRAVVAAYLGVTCACRCCASRLARCRSGDANAPEVGRRAYGNRCRDRRAGCYRNVVLAGIRAAPAPIATVHSGGIAVGTAST